MLSLSTLICATLLSLAAGQTTTAPTRDPAAEINAAIAAQSSAEAAIIALRSQGLSDNSAAVQSLLQLQTSIIVSGLHLGSQTVAGVTGAATLNPAAPTQTPSVTDATTSMTIQAAGPFSNVSSAVTVAASGASAVRTITSPAASGSLRPFLSLLPPASRASGSASAFSSETSSSGATGLASGQQVVSGLVALSALAIGALLVL